MGIYDIKIMNEVRKKLDEIDFFIIVLGEGWDLGIEFDVKLKVNQKNVQDMKCIVYFNDGM